MVPIPDRDVLKGQAQAAIDAASAALARGALTEGHWQRVVTDALAAAYLAEDDPRWQSGFDGDADLWREARAFLLDGVPASGSFLDVGCATGHLMECLATWGRERGLDLTTYGLEINSQLADAARRRLPTFRERIYTGNVSDWVPPRRFTYVRTGLEYVPPGRGTGLIQRILTAIVEPGGRILVGPMDAEHRAATFDAFASAGIPTPEVVQATDRNGKTRYVVWSAQLDVSRSRGRSTHGA